MEHGNIIDSKTVECLKSLSKDQMESLLALILQADIFEVPLNEKWLGRYVKNVRDCRDDEILETRLSMAASLISCNGKTAKDFEITS